MSQWVNKGVSQNVQGNNNDIGFKPGLHKIPRHNPVLAGGINDQVTRTRTGLREIKATQIESITDLSHGHPVFRVIFHGGGQLVLKAENAQGDVGTAKNSWNNGTDNLKKESKRYNAITATVSVIDPTATSEALNTSELKALKDCRYLGSADFRLWLTNPRSLWVKMPLVRDFVDFDVGKGHRENLKAEHTQKMQNLLQKLKGNALVWKSLGEVFVVDFFLGNTDRTEYQDYHGTNIVRAKRSGEGKLGKIKSLQGRIVNTGNLFFKFDESGNLKKALALDNFDPASENLKQTIYKTDGNDINLTDWKKNSGDILKGKNKSARKMFANHIVNDMVQHGNNYGVQVNFDQGEATSLAKGMEDGISKLKRRLVQAVKDPRDAVPEGIVKRMEFLRWK